MARKIIVLRWDNGGSRDVSAKVAFWCDVPAARQPHQARDVGGNTFVSAVWDATAPELTALRTGAVREFVVTYDRPGAPTSAQVRAFLEARFAEFQTETTNYNPWRFTGSSFDGTTWTTVTVA